MGRPLAFGRHRRRHLRASRLRRLFPTSRRPGVHQRQFRQRGAARRGRLSLSQQRSLLHERSQSGQSDFPVLPARRHQQSAPWLRIVQEPEPPRCQRRLRSPGQRRHARRSEPDRGHPGRLPDLRPQHPHQRAERGRRDEPLPAQRDDGYALRPRRPRMVLPLAGRRPALRRREPAGQPWPFGPASPTASTACADGGCSPSRAGSRISSSGPTTTPGMRSRSTAGSRPTAGPSFAAASTTSSLVRGGASPGPTRPQDQPQLSPAGLERPR